MYVYMFILTWFIPFLFRHVSLLRSYTYLSALLLHRWTRWFVQYIISELILASFSNRSQVETHS